MLSDLPIRKVLQKPDIAGQITSAKRQNKGSLLSAVLQTDALVKNTVTFFKLSSFMNAAFVTTAFINQAL